MIIGILILFRLRTKWRFRGPSASGAARLPQLGPFSLMAGAGRRSYDAPLSTISFPRRGEAPCHGHEPHSTAVVGPQVLRLCGLGLARRAGGDGGGRGARIPRCRHPGGKLPDRPGAAGHGPVGDPADRRPPPDAGVPFPPARRGKPDHRADQGRRHRHESHQCRGDRQLRAIGQRARAPFPVPVDRSSLQGHRRPAGR